jgi:invasion protein IalB
MGQKENEEPQMVSAIRKGADMLVEATSRRGTATSYSYSLSGITAALKQVAKCN